MQEFNYTIRIIFTGCITGKDKKEAKELLIKSFQDTEGIDVSEKEIIEFEEVKQ